MHDNSSINPANGTRNTNRVSHFSHLNRFGVYWRCDAQEVSYLRQVCRTTKPPLVARTIPGMENINPMEPKHYVGFCCSPRRGPSYPPASSAAWTAICRLGASGTHIKQANPQFRTRIPKSKTKSSREERKGNAARASGRVPEEQPLEEAVALDAGEEEGLRGGIGPRVGEQGQLPLDLLHLLGGHGCFPLTAAAGRCCWWGW